MNLNFPLAGDNRGGIRLFYFVPVEDVLSETDSEVTLKDTKVWFIGRGIKFTPKYKERNRSTRYGQISDRSLTGSIAKRTPSLDFVVNAMFGRKYIVVYHDFNDQLVRVGSVDQPLTFEYNADTGTQPGTRSGITFEFKGVITSDASYYTGALPTSDAPPIEPPVCEPSTVIWNDTVVARPNSGETLVITSVVKASSIQII